MSGPVSDPTARLARTYRLLLLAYPRWHRAERADEMLGTLLEAAESGQRRPRWRDRVDIVAGGLRCRLRPPRGAIFVLLVGTVALVGGFFGIAAVTMADRPRLPSLDSAAQAVATALPASAHTAPTHAERCDWCRDPVTGADRDTARFFSANPPVDEVAAVVAQAYGRLAAAGWAVSIRNAPDEPGETILVATGHGLRMTMVGEHGRTYLAKDLSQPDPRFVSIQVSVSSAIAASAMWRQLGGFVAGGLTGWMLSGYVSQSHRRRGARMRTALFVTGVAALLVVAGSVQVILLALPQLWNGMDVRAIVADRVTAAPPLVALAAVILLLPVVLAWLPARTRDGAWPDGLMADPVRK